MRSTFAIAGPGAVYVALPSALAALHPDSGRLLPGWRPRLSLTTGIYAGANVGALAPAGGRVYVAGMFDGVRGKRRLGVAALDTGTARTLPAWSPRANRASGSLVVRSGSRVLVGIELAPGVDFDVAGMEAWKQPLKSVDLVLALSGKGRVRVGLGRKCDYARWAETGHCLRPVSRWLGSVHFARAMRKRWRRPLGLPPGSYFLRFVPRAESGPPQAPYDIAFRHS